MEKLRSIYFISGRRETAIVIALAVAILTGEIAQAAPPAPQDTPVNTFVKLCKAIEENDRAALDDCLYTAQTADRPTTNFAAIESTAAIFHLKQVWLNKFNADMSIPGFSFGSPSEEALDQTSKRLVETGGQISVEGDLAVSKWPLAPDIFGGGGRYLQLSRWVGGQLVLRRVNGDWKLDLDRSFDQVVIVNRMAGNSNDTMQIKNQTERDLCDGFNELARQIEDGTIATAAQSANSAKAVALDAFRRAGINESHDIWLPVTGGEMLAPRIAAVPKKTPTTEPQGQETPVNALSKLCTALEQNDVDAIDECICDDGVDAAYADLGRAWLRGEAATIRIEKDWSDKFRQGLAVSKLNLETFPTGSFNIALRGILEDPNGADVKTLSDEAQVRIPSPPEAFAGQGVDRVAPLERWSGARLVLRQIDGVWKLDTDRTFLFWIFLTRMQGNNDDAIDVAAQILTGVAAATNDIAGQIETGHLDTEKKARAAITALTSPVFKSARINGSNLFVLPVLGGTP